MKKSTSIFAICLSILFLSGCGGCKNLSEDSCRENDKCVNIYKPCNKIEVGCKNNKSFTECRTKKITEKTTETTEK